VCMVSVLFALNSRGHVVVEGSRIVHRQQQQPGHPLHKVTNCLERDTKMALRSRAKLEAKRTVHVLQLCSVLLFTIGLVSVLLKRWPALVPLGAGTVGSVGLFFNWYRVLVLFAVLAWATVVVVAIELFFLVSHPSDVGDWAIWLLTGICAIPIAVLMSTLHLLRVWTRASSEQMAPLVDPVTEPLPTSAAVGVSQPVQNLPKQAQPALSRPVWPPTCTGGASTEPTPTAVAGDTSEGRGAQVQGTHAGGRVWPPPPKGSE